MTGIASTLRDPRHRHGVAAVPATWTLPDPIHIQPRAGPKPDEVDVPQASESSVYSPSFPAVGETYSTFWQAPALRLNGTLMRLSELLLRSQPGFSLVSLAVPLDRC